jgi:2-dehydro-3-deoxyphosphogalactonate aldolase
MTALADFTRYFAACPLIAIIRSVTPDEAEAIGEAILSAGIRVIEVPLNSPEPLLSIERLARRFGNEAMIGAGTVLDPEDVKRIAQVGGRIIVSPSTDIAVIKQASQDGLVSAPGFFTPSEAFTALHAGAHALKLFPAEAASPAVVKSIKAVLPKDIPLIVVGGVKPDGMRAWLDAGANGFGLGSGLYKPGQSAAEVAAQARAYVEGLGA